MERISVYWDADSDPQNPGYVARLDGCEDATKRNAAGPFPMDSDLTEESPWYEILDAAQECADFYGAKGNRDWPTAPIPVVLTDEQDLLIGTVQVGGESQPREGQEYEWNERAAG